MRMLVLTLICLALAPGCGARQPTDTLDEALDEASRAMQEGDAPALMGMMDEKLKVGVTEESLQKDLEKNKNEYGSLAALMEAPAKVELRATLEGKSGQSVDMVLEGETWKLATPVELTESATDPIQALTRLAAELDAMRVHLAESGLLAEQHQKGFLTVLEKLAAEILQVRPEDLVLAEDRCYCNLPSGRKIELVREEGVWKVFSIFPPIEFR